MEKKDTIGIKILPVMFGFFIMGFVDIIGIAINYVKQDFIFLNDTLANMLAMSCFFWFLVLSIPTGMLMNKIGRKRTVLLSFVLQVIAFCIPIISYDFIMVMIAFAVVGIGNTLLQVALNPLVTDVVQKGKLTGTLTLGQFVKAVCSFLGPIITSWASGMAFGWKLIFPVYAVTSLIALVWLWLTPIEESKKGETVSFRMTFRLFNDTYIVAFFIGILVLVGVDVGMNTTFPKLLMERCGLELNEAGLGNSVYFFARTLGALGGGIFLLKYSETKFFTFSVLLAAIGLVGMLMTGNLWAMLACVVIFGLGYANLFAIIFSLSLKRVSDRANEVSALLIMGVSGGALLPPLLGVVSDKFGTQIAALLVITIVWLYMVWLIGKVKGVSNK
ncbi:MFS transporter [Proteiniphilum acetatigenes]|uniref:MFS transporter n=1 Tax=Proteiniphilum acetatigenes TaxID=294710 RepID=UPI000364DE05|nr:MFS transporter [Proteiniphilum acetatigenes]